MKNLTLRLDERKLDRARRIAAERSTSVNALIRDYLDDLVATDDRQVQARRELLRLCKKSKAKVGKRSWSREDVYER